MALQEGDRKNFKTLLKAATNGDLAVVESRRNSDGKYVALIAIIYQEHPGGEYLVMPVGEMVSGNPFELYADPTNFGGPHEWSPRDKKKK